jgi:hypothetical protein
MLLGLGEELVVEHLGLWDTLEERVAEVQGFGPYYEPKHRLLGHPQLIQGPGLEEGTRLLFQVDSDCIFFDKGYPRTGMMWGDAGASTTLWAMKSCSRTGSKLRMLFWKCRERWASDVQLASQSALPVVICFGRAWRGPAVRVS